MGINWPVRPVWFNQGIRINHCSPVIETSAFSSSRTNMTARMSEKATKGASLCVLFHSSLIMFVLCCCLCMLFPLCIGV